MASPSLILIVKHPSVQNMELSKGMDFVLCLHQ